MVEEVTVSSATAGADSSGQGAVQIKFVMRSGTNRFIGSAYAYTRHPKLNTNNWFNIRSNLPKNEIILNQYGVREGGPIVIPGVFDGRGKAFFFFNVEQLRYPLSNTRTRNILGPLAQQGIFRYGAGGAPTGQSARPRGQKRPHVDARSHDCRTGREDSGGDRDDRRRQRPHGSERAGVRLAAESLRIDNVQAGGSTSTSARASPEHELQLPGAAVDAESVRRRRAELSRPGESAELYSAVSRGSATLRSTFGKSWSTSCVWVSRMRRCISPIRSIRITSPTRPASTSRFRTSASALTGATTNRAPSSRNGKSWNLDNTVNWMIGQPLAPVRRVVHPDERLDEEPERSSRRHAGRRHGQRSRERDVRRREFPRRLQRGSRQCAGALRLLTGRVTSVVSEVRLDGETGLVYMGPAGASEQQDEIGLFVQDSWRLRPNLTSTPGCAGRSHSLPGDDERVFDEHARRRVWRVGTGERTRWPRMQSVHARSVAPAAGCPSTGATRPAARGYETEYDNFAPNAGVAWQPKVTRGWLRALLGDPDSGHRARELGCRVQQRRTGLLQWCLQRNAGSAVTTTRSTASAQFPLVPPGQAWPVLLRDTTVSVPRQIFRPNPCTRWRSTSTTA